MVGEKIEEGNRHWENFLLHLSIVDYTFAPVISDGMLIRFGPLVRFWVMQFKGKHNSFKDIAHCLKCYHNVEKSMVERHQLYSSYMSMSALDKKILTGVGK